MKRYEVRLQGLCGRVHTFNVRATSRATAGGLAELLFRERAGEAPRARTITETGRQ